MIEGAAYSLQVHPDPKLDAYVDGLIKKIAHAQEPDGYLYTWRTIYDKEKAAGTPKEATTGQFHRGSDQRWEREDQHSHELYNVGHLYEAAVAHYLATGKRSLLDVALKNADLVEKTFGWGKIQKATGHQEIELGLAKLYLVTGEKKYLDLAKFFLDEGLRRRVHAKPPKSNRAKGDCWSCRAGLLHVCLHGRCGRLDGQQGVHPSAQCPLGRCRGQKNVRHRRHWQQQF
ncbi:MAG: glycoside hydrolase family 127 protein [Saprospiraceae bacterium]|nr:glycoside hydrolase family 127 protein [Saprospiraceae bacterium]